MSVASSKQDKDKIYVGLL